MTSPFGIPFFSDVHNLPILNEFGQNKFAVEAPTPHPLFQTYVVQATPALGVVWVKGLSEARMVDIYGNALRTEVDRVAQQLSGKYGHGAKTDLLMSGSFWEGPQYWMNSLADQQRLYFYLWDAKGRASLPEDLMNIYLGATGYSGSEGAVTLEYSSNRMDEAERETEIGMSDVL